MTGSAESDVALEASDVQWREPLTGVAMQTLSRNYVTSVDDLPLRIMSEFDEQPGLRLTGAQIRRLWNLSERTCWEVMGYLVGNGLLAVTTDGRYCLPRYAG